MGAKPVIAPSARKHGVSDRNILHAYANPIRVFELDEGLTMLIGGDVSAVLYEIGGSRQRPFPSSSTPCEPAPSS